MMPSLYSFETWRLHYFNHMVFPNMWDEDTAAWHPVSVTVFRNMQRWQQQLWRVVFCTPLKLFASIGHWCRSFDGFDLKAYHQQSRVWMLISWALPFGFMAFAWPAIIASGGLGAWCSYWLMPWLVFHGWLSLITLIQHTAPHIPFVPSGSEYDEGRAAVSGTVTLQLPRWLAFIINDVNYHVPQHLSNAIPFYHLHAAYKHLADRLGPYLTECTLNPTLLTNLITAWQVYDEEQQMYITVNEALETEEGGAAGVPTEDDPSGLRHNGRNGDVHQAAWHKNTSQEKLHSSKPLSGNSDSLDATKSFDDAYSMSS